MGLKVLKIVLTTIVVICVAVILAVALWPDKAKKAAEMVQEGPSLVARRPPPRPVEPETTPTPIPPPESQAIARRIRVSPEDYPFRLTETSQSAGRMRVTLDVRNESGREWPVTYLTLSSAFHSERTHYRIDTWKRGEVRSIDYVFPTAEMSERLRELRIEDVSAVPPTDGLSLFSAATSPERSASEGDAVLRLWRGLRTTAGVPPPSSAEMAEILAEISPEAAERLQRGTGITISLGGLAELTVDPVALEGVPARSREIRMAYNDGLESAHQAIVTMKALAEVLAKAPWAEVMAPQAPGARLLADVRQSLDRFQQRAVEIHQINRRTPSRETQTLNKNLDQASEILLVYSQALERQIRAAQPGFSLYE